MRASSALAAHTPGHRIPVLGLVPAGKQDPCIDSEAEAYLNRRDVQLALHANVSGQLPGPWQDCTPRIEYSR